MVCCVSVCWPSKQCIVWLFCYQCHILHHSKVEGMKRGITSPQLLKVVLDHESTNLALSDHVCFANRSSGRCVFLLLFHNLSHTTKRGMKSKYAVFLDPFAK